MITIHERVEQDLNHLEGNPKAKCSSCAFAEEVGTLDGGTALLCGAALYDTKTLACYVKREVDQPLTLWELKKLAEDRPAMVWTVDLDEKGKPDLEHGEWMMFTGELFVGADGNDRPENYSETFVAYLREQA